MPLPPLSRLRKGVVFFTILLFVFILSRFLFKKKSYSPLPEEEVQSVHADICLLSSSGVIDSVFYLKNGINKIFAYSYLADDFNAADTVWHTWYYNSERVKNIPCTVENFACFSSISIDSLREGDWSVDIRQNGVLMNIKQFKIKEP